MNSQIKSLSEFLDAPLLPSPEWQVSVIKSDDCQSYVAWNEKNKEALVIDPKQEDFDAYLSFEKKLAGYLWLAVIDTHTHADHISSASKLAKKLNAPLIMSSHAPSARVDLKLTSKQTHLASRSAPIEIVHTPGHTPDSITVLWGPFIFGGDTLLYGDVGRDDLPGGDATSHFDSLEFLKPILKADQILLPGHDHKGPRASTWKTQIEINTSLTQSRESFIQEATDFNGSAPKLLKESLKENFK